MSARRTAVELSIIVGGLCAIVFVVVWGAGHLAGALTAWVPVETERGIGGQAFEAIVRASPVCDDPSARRYVERVAEPLIAALHTDRYQFTFSVLDSDEVNAFALPGGYIVVHFGLLESARAGDEVAAVLAHEIEHVVRRHGTKRILRALGGTAALGTLFGGTDVFVPANALADFLHNAYDRDQEREADERGRELLMRAGIEPAGMARFFERLERTTVTPPELLSTHPDPGDRAEAAARAGRGFEATTELPPPTGLRCH